MHSFSDVGALPTQEASCYGAAVVFHVRELSTEQISPDIHGKGGARDHRRYGTNEINSNHRSMISRQNEGKFNTELAISV